MRSSLFILLVVGALLLGMLGSPAGALQVEADTIRIGWAAAPGPVSGYVVFLDRNGSGFLPVSFTGPDHREVQISGVLGDQVRMRVAAWSNLLQSMGPTSASSVLIRFASLGPTVVANGGFEQGPDPMEWLTLYSGSPSPAGWNVSSGSVDYLGSVLAAAEGWRSLELSGGDAGGVSQLLTTEPGREYQVRFALSANSWGPRGDYPLQVTAGGTLRYFVAEGVGDSSFDLPWRVEGFDFIAQGPTTQLDFQSLVPGYYGPIIDDVRVRPYY